MIRTKSLGSIGSMICLLGILGACGSDRAPELITASATTTSKPAVQTEAQNELDSCPTPKPTSGETIERSFTSWRQIAQDETLFRDEITWIDSGPSGGPSGDLIPVRAIDLSGGGTERDAVGAFDDISVAAIREALAQHSRVIAATAPHVRSEGYVSQTFLIVIPRSGEPFFVGSCAKRDWEDNLRGTFGSGYADAVASLAQGPIKVPETPTPKSPFLLPGDAPAELLNSLNHVALEFELPALWAGIELDQSYVLITRIGDGWNEALPLTWANRNAFSTRIGAYIPDRGDVELWVLGNDGDVRSPVTRLATFDAEDMLRLSAQGTRDNVDVVRITIDSEQSALDLVKGGLLGKVSLSGLK